MEIKTHADAIQVLSNVDAALNRMVTQGFENAFILAGSHNDLLAVVDYLNKETVCTKTVPKTTPESTEKE